LERPLFETAWESPGTPIVAAASGTERSFPRVAMERNSNVLAVWILRSLNGGAATIESGYLVGGQPNWSPPNAL
jgi:hypothetical protein